MTPTGIDLGGVMIPTTTPFDPVTGELELRGFARNLERWAPSGVRGFVVGGSTGESVLLDEDERERAWEVARDVAPPGKLVVAGVGAESRRATLRMAARAAAAGADAVLVQPPAYFRGAMTPEVLREHYQAVADGSPLPVIIYQVPTRLSTIELPSGLVGELSSHERIVGVKESRSSLGAVAELVERVQPGFQILVGSGAHLFASLEIGALGGILGVANVAPRECVRLHEHFRAGRMAEAGALQRRVGALHKVLVVELGVAGIKHALDLLGHVGGVPRAPLRPLAAKGRARVAAALEAAGLTDGRSRP